MLAVDFSDEVVKNLRSMDDEVEDLIPFGAEGRLPDAPSLLAAVEDWLGVGETAGRASGYVTALEVAGPRAGEEEDEEGAATPVVGGPAVRRGAAGLGAFARAPPARASACAASEPLLEQLLTCPPGLEHMMAAAPPEVRAGRAWPAVSLLGENLVPAVAAQGASAETSAFRAAGSLAGGGLQEDARTCPPEPADHWPAPPRGP